MLRLAMSLTGELRKKDSPVTRWFTDRLPNTKPISKAWYEQVKPVPIARPKADLRIPGTVGTAFDYRLRYYLARTPLEHLVAGAGLRLLDPSRTLTSPSCFSPDAILDRRGPPPSSAGAVIGLIADFQQGLTATLDDLTPVGQVLDDAGEELLCRYCYLLGLFEEFFRAGLEINSPLFQLADGATLADLLALVPAIWIEDLCELSRLFAPHVTEFARQPLVLNPFFTGSGEIGGADADLIAASCLVDIKTTVDPKFSRNRLLYQVLGYVLLDYDDAYAIDSIGIYLSRQGLLVRWPLAPLLETLLAGEKASLRELRSSFRDAVLISMLIRPK